MSAIALLLIVAGAWAVWSGITGTSLVDTVSSAFR